MVNGYKKILPGQVFHLDGTRCTMGIAQRSGGNCVLDGRRKTSPGMGVEKFVWTIAKILRLDGRRNSSFGRLPKYFVWTVAFVWMVVEILRLDGHQNSLFGRSSKFVFWTDVQNLDSGICSGWAAKNFFWEVQTNWWIMHEEVMQSAVDGLSIDSDLSRFVEKNSKYKLLGEWVT